MVVSNVHSLLITRVTELEQQQAKMEQYSRRNNVDISGISNEVSDENLEKKVIDICKESGIDLNPCDIEACHRLPSENVNTSNSKRVIVKFVNRKHSEAMLRLKKSINSHSNAYITNSLCPYYWFLCDKCKDLQRKGLINQVFCLGAVVTIKIRENGPPIKIFHENDFLVYQEMTGAVPFIPKGEVSLSLCNINACSLNRNFDDLVYLLKCTNKNFDIIAVVKLEYPRKLLSHAIPT